MPGRSLSLVLVSSEWEGGSESPFRDWKGEFCKLQQVQKVPAFLCRLDLGGRGGASAGWLSTPARALGKPCLSGLGSAPLHTAAVLRETEAFYCLLVNVYFRRSQMLPYSHPFPFVSRKYFPLDAWDIWLSYFQTRILSDTGIGLIRLTFVADGGKNSLFHQQLNKNFKILKSCWSCE